MLPKQIGAGPPPTYVRHARSDLSYLHDDNSQLAAPTRPKVTSASALHCFYAYATSRNDAMYGTASKIRF